MDFRDLPTAGDYAQDSANKANKHVDDLDDEVRSLRERVVALENIVGQLTFRLDHIQAISDRDRLGHGHERASRTGAG